MLTWGVTVNGFTGHFPYDRKRHREITTVVFVAPELLAENYFDDAAGPPINWSWCATSFLNSWAHAYGLDENFDEEEEGEGGFWEGAIATAFPFTIGEGGGIQQRFR
jgi:hypothetical protein